MLNSCFSAATEHWTPTESGLAARSSTTSVSLERCGRAGWLMMLFMLKSHYLFLKFAEHLLVSLCLSPALLSPSFCFILLSVVEAFEEVSDSLCVPQYSADGEERVILFLKMVPGKPFCPELAARIRGAIRKALSARHVPALLLGDPRHSCKNTLQIR